MLKQAIIVTVLSLCGCEKATQQSDSTAAGRESERGNADVSSETALSKTDSALLELVLNDLISFKDFHSEFGDKESKKIILHQESGGPSGFLLESQIRIEVRGKDISIPAEICADLVRRNTRVVSLASVTSRKGIVVANLSDVFEEDGEGYALAFTDQYPDAKGYAHAWMPGYSRDGRTAVVRMFVGPTSHGATATYLLTKHDGQWTINARWVARYA